MTPETLIIFGVAAFFGIFGITLLAVSIWSNGAPAEPQKSETIPARRPSRK